MSEKNPTYSTSLSQSCCQSVIMPDSENKNMMADGTNHMTSHDNDDEGQRRKRHRGLILRLKQKKNCKSELKKFSSVTLFSSVYIQCFSILHSNH